MLPQKQCMPNDMNSKPKPCLKSHLRHLHICPQPGQTSCNTYTKSNVKPNTECKTICRSLTLHHLSYLHTQDGNGSSPAPIPKGVPLTAQHIDLRQLVFPYCGSRSAEKNHPKGGIKPPQRVDTPPQLTQWGDKTTPWGGTLCKDKTTPLRG